ncbi:MAG: excinuclease ABC subunit UvrC [Candidatus Kerfeldbacteria bacterium]|nr:excinuclease ABC subunit UvrC [Candidatus Kerfeldbacteria bacterium]
MINTLKDTIANLPAKPGVYLFKNRQGNVLYVGKAKSLKHRVTSYFQTSTDLSDAKAIMVQQIVTVDWIEAKTETDALVLEDTLIKDFQPRFNILAKDDKSFLYVHITAEPFPQVLAVRRPNLTKGGLVYGPYPFARSLRAFLKLLHNIFPYRTCTTLPKKPCLEYYLGRCQAPCINGISAADYATMIDQVIDCVEGNAQPFVARLEQTMQQAVQHQQFEQAARIRDQLQAITTLQSLRKTPQRYVQEYYAHRQRDAAQGLVELAAAIQLNKPPQRIEIYDISNVQGSHSVGSMVVFQDGLPAKADYRRFKIKTVSGPNDFASLREVVTRRLRRTWPLPDLTIIDGGKGQLSAVAGLWQIAQVPVIGLAKRREEIFQPATAVPIILAPGSQGLFLIQRMRDEAHRFAITYYRLLHRKTMRSTRVK